MADFYDILGVAHDASPDEIKRAYRKVSRENHPDALVGESEERRNAGEERFKSISVAYETLSNPDKRSLYDRDPESASRHGTTERSSTNSTPFNDDWMDDALKDARKRSMQQGIFMPDNEFALITALIDAYKHEGDAEWIVNRTEADREVRKKMPEGIYKVVKEGNDVNIFRRVVDMRDFGQTKKPIDYDDRRPSDPWDAFVNVRDIGRIGVGPRLNVRKSPHDFSRQMDGYKLLARKLSTMPEGQSVSLDELVNDPLLNEVVSRMEHYNIFAHYAQKETQFGFDKRHDEKMRPLFLNDVNFWHERERDRGLIHKVVHGMTPEGQHKPDAEGAKRGFGFGRFRAKAETQQGGGNPEGN